jgi:uncharacterized protein (TIGR00730 family)
MSDAPERPGHSVCDNEETTKIIESTLHSLWSAANELARVRPRSARFRVTIFGSSRIAPGDPVYREVVELSRRLAERGCDIVTGGGPGLMQAANEGERLGDPEDRTRSVGIRISLPFEQGVNPFVETVYIHRTFFTRLHHFVRISDAFVVVPGGIGTTLELFMVWQLLQVRQAAGVPLLVLGSMWHELVEWARCNMTGGSTHLASPADMDIPVCVSSADEAFARLEEHIDRAAARED